MVMPSQPRIYLLILFNVLATPETFYEHTQKLRRNDKPKYYTVPPSFFKIL